MRMSPVPAAEAALSTTASPPPCFAQRRFAAAIARLGFAFDPARGRAALVLAGSGGQARVGIEFTARGGVDYDATLAKAQAVHALHRATADRLAEAVATGKMFDRARAASVRSGG
jgi:hypothetical protein